MPRTHPSENPSFNTPAMAASDIPETSSIRAIKYLTCQGGGMKAVGQVGAIEALEKCGVLAQLEEVAGSSAGGIIATLLALGCTAEEVRTEMMNINFIALQDKEEPGWIESTRIKDLAKGGSEFAYSVPEKIGLIKKVPMGRKGGVVSTLEKIEDVVGVALGTELGLWKGEALAHCISNIVARKTGKPDITFQELAVLAEANGSPFKKLILTGSNLTDGILEYYNAANTPNMSIVDAVRISASFPGAYKPVIQDEKVKVDGGLLENLPDVFNKPPYVSGQEVSPTGVNPQAFALSFQSSEQDVPKTIHNGIDLAKALYSSVMSEQHLQKKYGSNIAYIDTVGLKTLEFDAPREKKVMALQSGAAAVHQAFQKILAVEEAQPPQYHQMSIEELTRRERGLIGILEADQDALEIKLDIKEELILIGEEIISRNMDEGLLADCREKAEREYLRKQKLLHPKTLSDEELSALCKSKAEELERVVIELGVKLKQLKLARHALEFNRDQILTRFTGQWEGNTFEQELHQLKRFEDLLYENRIKKIATKNKDEQLFLETQYAQLKLDRAQYVDGLIAKYQSNQDTLLTDFFQDIKIDMQRVGFKIPNTLQDLTHYCSEDIYACMEYINACVREVKTARQDQALHKEYTDAFLARTDKSNQFDTLLQMEAAIKQSIYRKTTLIAKTNDYLVRKAPKLKKVITPFLKTVAVLGFVCWLPLAIPAVGIAKAISHFSANPETRTTAENVVNFFHWTDLDMHKRLRGVQADTALFIKKMSDNYVSADRSEGTYLKRLYADCLKNSGVALEDIFIKDPNESIQQYKERLKVAEQRLAIEFPQSSVLPSNGNGGDSKLQVFKTETNSAVSRATEKEMQHIAARNLESGGQYSSKKQQVRSIHLGIIQEAETKIAQNQVLTDQEILDYSENARLTNKALSEDFRTRYSDTLLKLHKHHRTVQSTPKEKSTLSQESSQDKQSLALFSKERKKRHLGKAHGKLQPGGHVPHRKKRPHNQA